MGSSQPSAVSPVPEYHPLCSPMQAPGLYRDGTHLPQRKGKENSPTLRSNGEDALLLTTCFLTGCSAWLLSWACRSSLPEQMAPGAPCFGHTACCDSHHSARFGDLRRIGEMSSYLPGAILPSEGVLKTARMGRSFLVVFGAMLCLIQPFLLRCGFMGSNSSIQ